MARNQKFIDHTFTKQKHNIFLSIPMQKLHNVTKHFKPHTKLVSFDQTIQLSKSVSFIRLHDNKNMFSTLTFQPYWASKEVGHYKEVVPHAAAPDIMRKTMRTHCCWCLIDTRQSIDYCGL